MKQSEGKRFLTKTEFRNQPTIQGELFTETNALTTDVVGDGGTDDSSNISNALDSNSTIVLPPKTYKISSDFSVDSGESLIFMSGASFDIDSGVTITFSNGSSIEAPREHIFELADTTSGIEMYGPDVLYPEWVGLSRGNSSSTNKTNWDKAIVSLFKHQPSQGTFKIDLSSGEYPFDVPFYLPPRVKLHGKTMWATTLDLKNSNAHGVEVVTIESNSITTDGNMSSSNTYSALKNMEINAFGISQSNGRYFICYMTGWSSGIIEGCRINGPHQSGDYTSLMDAVFLGPTYNTSGNENGAIRNVVRDNRITNFRDGIICGRFDFTKTSYEPAGGGSNGEVAEPGECYENEIYGNYCAGGGTEPILCPRYGIRFNYDNNTSRRDKPYSIVVQGNTFDGDNNPGTLSGDVTKSSSSSIVTGSNTSFTSEINLDNAPVSLFFSDGENLRISSVDSDTQITLQNSASSNSTDSNVQIRKGVGIEIDTAGVNIVVIGNYIDQWHHSIRATSNSTGCFVMGNDGAGNPWSNGADNGTENFFHHVASGSVSIHNTP